MRYLLLLIIFAPMLVVSCTKVEVTFGNDSPGSDPDISFSDDYPVEIATYKIDSFVTSGHEVFTIGFHHDPQFGTIYAGSYSQISLPADNPVKDKNVSFDSLVLILKPNGNYYGDTTISIKFDVRRLTEKVENEDDNDNNFYNPRKISFEPIDLGSVTRTVRPTRDTSLRIRLSDAFGAELLQKFKTNNTAIQSETNFINYFKGLYITADSSQSNTLLSFTKGSSAFLRLHYKLNSTFSEEKYFDFSFNTSRQFNHIQYYHGGTPLSVFTPFKKQLKNSSLTGHKAFLHSNMGSYIKISFPTILSLKELHPYIKVIKAELVIKPGPGTYSYPYQLPQQLYLYQTDDNNGLNGLLADAAGQSAMTGNLYVDDLYGETTQYSYDITSFITTLINEGSFSKSALMLSGVSEITDSKTDRLVINDQSLSKSIQLKLYVLGL